MLKNIKQWISLTYIGVASLAVLVLLATVIIEHNQSSIIVTVVVPIIGALSAAFFGAKIAGDISLKNQDEKFKLDRTRLQVDAANNLILQIQKAKAQLLSFAKAIETDKEFVLNQIKKLPFDQRFSKINFKVESLTYICPRKNENKQMENNNAYWWYQPLTISATIDLYNTTIERWDNLFKEIRQDRGLLNALWVSCIDSDNAQLEFVNNCSDLDIANIVYKYQQLLVFTEHLILLFNDFTTKFPEIVREKTDDNYRIKHDLIVMSYTAHDPLKKLHQMRFIEIQNIMGASGHKDIQNIKSSFEPYIKYIAAIKTPTPADKHR